MSRTTLLVATVLGLVIIASASVDAKSAYQQKMENFALSRDGLYRENPDDDFTHGFFAAWPVILLVIAAVFLVVAFISLIGYGTGLCATPEGRGTYQPAAQV